MCVSGAADALASDLLCRVRQDIYRMHQDLAQRIQSVHLDLRRLIGVLVPDLEQALEQQAHRETHTIAVPEAISERFHREAVSGLPFAASGDGAVFDLEQLGDAFVLHFNNSTTSFVAGILVENKQPPTEQYINLLKCVWLMDKIKNSEEFREQNADSHWPSYIIQLEDVSISLGSVLGCI